MLWPGWIRHFHLDCLYTVCQQGRIHALVPREQLEILKHQVGERYNREFLRGVYGKAPYFHYKESERRVLYRWHAECTTRKL